MKLRLHPQVPRDQKDILTYTFERFGKRQMLAYKDLISEAMARLLEQPTAGALREDIGAGIRILSISQPGRRSSHGFIYRAIDDDVIEVLRLVYLPLIPASVCCPRMGRSCTSRKLADDPIIQVKLGKGVIAAALLFPDSLSSYEVTLATDNALWSAMDSDPLTVSACRTECWKFSLPGPAPHATKTRVSP